MNPIHIRPATPVDGETILQLVRALADYEKLDPPDVDAQQRLLADAFAEKPRFEVYLAEERTADQSPAVVGYAFVFETYSTFLALPTLYLEDLFVLPEQRGKKAGLALFRYVVAEAERRGCGRVDFAVLDWNQLARDFYHRLGAAHLDDWCCYRISRDQFAGILSA